MDDMLERSGVNLCDKFILRNLCKDLEKFDRIILIQQIHKRETVNVFSRWRYLQKLS